MCSIGTQLETRKRTLWEAQPNEPSPSMAANGPCRWRMNFLNIFNNFAKLYNGLKIYQICPSRSPRRLGQCRGPRRLKEPHGGRQRSCHCRVGMAAGGKLGGGQNNTPAPAKVKITCHPHPPLVSGLNFSHTRHPRG
jgi:hypothetical protein